MFKKIKKPIKNNYHYINLKSSKLELKKLYLFIILIPISFGVPTQSKAQLPIARELYNIPIGKHNNHTLDFVFDINQDTAGYIYASTNKGIYRYDGFQFDKLNQKINYYFGGSSIKFHKNGQLFYENFDGHVFNYNEKKKWTVFSKNKPVHYLEYGLFDNHLAYVFKDGIAIYDITTTKQIHTIPYKIGYPQHTTQNENYFFLINESSISKFDNKKLLKEYTFLSKNDHNTIRQLYYNNNVVYVVPRSEHKKGIQIFDSNLNFIQNIFIPEINGIINNIEFIDNQIWVLTSEGIYVYIETNHQWVLKQQYFKNLNATDIHKGKKNELWLSTLGQGIFLIPNQEQGLYRVINEKLTQIIPSGKDFIIGTVNGKILKVDRKFDSYQIINKSHYNSALTFLYQHNEDSEIFYVSGVGFNVINGENVAFYDNALKDVAYIDNDFYALATSSDILLYKSKDFKSNSIWNSLFKKRAKNNKWASILNGKRSKSIVHLKNENNIYFLTNIGLFYIDQNGNETEVLHNNKSILAEKMKVTDDEIYLLNYEGQLLKYTKSSISELNEIKEVVLDIKTINNELLIKTTSGFKLLKSNHKTLQNLKTNILTNSVKDFTYDAEGNLLALTAEGIVQILKKNAETKIDYDTFKITNSKVNGKEFNYRNDIQLPYYQNNINFQLALLDFNSPNIPDIEFRLNNGPWETLPADTRELQFHQLAPGKYSIDFKLDENVINRKIKFNINPPFWYTWQFYLVITLLIICVLFIYYNKKRKSFKRHIHLLEEKISLEQELSKSILISIKAQMNPHFFFNALNSIQAFIYKNDSKQALSYLTKFSRLTRIILNQTDVDHIKLTDEINMLKLYLDLEQIRFNHNFDYEIKSKLEINSENILIPAMLIQPYVENCIKHGFLNLMHKGRIDIKFEHYSNRLKVTIIDNGIGREQSRILQSHHEAQSFSTNANKKRLEILNQFEDYSIEYTDITDDNNRIKGTAVKLYIPFKLEKHVN